MSSLTVTAIGLDRLLTLLLIPGYRQHARSKKNMCDCDRSSLDFVHCRLITVLLEFSRSVVDLGWGNFTALSYNLSFLIHKLENLVHRSSQSI